MTASARGFPSHGTARVYWFSTSARPRRTWRRSMEIACRMSSGSKPATTRGLPKSRATKAYGRQPITVETCPGPMNPSSLRSGDSRMALMAGRIVTWLQRTEKFRTPSAAARRTVSAVEGAVVSNPIATKTTRRSGCCRAIRSASSGK